MKYRVLLIIPFFFGLIHLLGYFSFSTFHWYEQFLRVEILVVKLLSFCGFLIAALKFKKKEHLRRAWLMMATNSLLLFFSGLLFHSFMPNLVGKVASILIQGLVLGVGNVCFVLGSVMLARTWHAAGLMFPGPKWKKWLTVAVTIALAIIIAGQTAVGGFLRLLGGSLETWDVINFISATADVIALSLIAPLFMTASALRGGLLRWPWIFLTSILFFWLCFDAAFSWGPSIGITGSRLTCVYELFRVLACSFGISAGLAQRFVMQQTSRPITLSP